MSDEIAAYDAFARRILASEVITDPWLAGEPRFQQEPVRLSRAEQRALYRAAEDVAAVYDELCDLVGEAPELLDSFFAMTPYQKAMWLGSRPLWHGIARADVFMTDEGLAVAELNCDTPTGEAEAVVLSALAAEENRGALDPNEGLEARFCAMVEVLARETAKQGKVRAVGLVYPTELTEDLSLVRLYRRWFAARGYEVILGSPYNLTYGAEGPSLFGRPFSIMLRHYKTDWWGERVSAWDDEGIPDADPLAGPLGAALTGVFEQRAAVVNPFGAVLPQNKRSMAFMWEHIHRFSPRGQEVIQRYIPVTNRLEVLHKEQLLAQQGEWVIKSDYGAEGDQVIVGREVSATVWRAALEHARPGRWVGQRYFAARRGAGGEATNLGVYLVAGEASGLYARVSVRATDERAKSAPVIITK